MLVLITRQGELNSLDLQRELNALDQVVSRQTTIAIGDCQFERAVCDMFRPRGDSIYLFKADKVYEYASMKSTVSKADLLEYLSGDNHIKSSLVKNEDTREYLKQLTGRVSADGWTPWLIKSEEYLQAKAKAIFKQAGLSHWSDTVKIPLFILAFMVPIFMIILYSCLAVMFSMVNACNRKRYEEEVKDLELEIQELTKEADKLR